MQPDPNWILFAIVGGLVCWVILRGRSRRLSKGQTEQTKRPLQEGAMSGQDELLNAINTFRAAVGQASAREAQKQRSGLQDAQATIERARKWVKESGVGVAACSLYEASKPWPAWAKRDDWSKWNVLGVTDVEGGGSITDKSFVAFTRQGCRWLVTHAQSESYLPDDNCLRGRLTINVGGNDVLELAVSKDFEDYSNWRPVDVHVLTIGNWAAELVEMEVVLEQARKRNLANFEAERLQAQAAKIRF